jgi:hypothetical protein
VIARPLESTGLTGDQIPADTLTFENLDTIRSLVRTEESNVEVINLLNSVFDGAGMGYSGLAPIRGTMQTKTQALTNNAVSYVDFGPGVWHITDIVVLLQGGSGTITYRAYAYDATDGNPALELVFGSNTSSTLFNFNGDSQFDHFQNQFFGETINNGSRQLGLKPSGTFDAGTMTAYILCHRVR